MKNQVFLSVLIAAVVICSSQLCLAQPWERGVCIPQAVIQVPVTVQVLRDPGLAICSESQPLSVSENFTVFIEPRIVENYSDNPSLLEEDCRFLSLSFTSCSTHGRLDRRVILNYQATLTCNSGCIRHRSNRQSLSAYKNQLNVLRRAVRNKRAVTLEDSYEGAAVSLFYFRGRKGSFDVVCRGRRFGSLRNLDLCTCPADCPDICSLRPETGLCRAAFPRFFHNSTTRQCERFIYGGCGGNQNNFETVEECQRECKVCTNGKVFESCGTACPRTCDNKDEIAIPCTLQCVEDCFCPEGTVELGDKCVAPEDCPGIRIGPGECPAGKVFLDCGTACPTTCKNKDDLLICTLQCVTGCFCAEGTIELGDKCVAPEDCPVEQPECPEGKEYQECGTACPGTCDNKDEPEPRPCPEICVQDCFCPEGTVELDDKCVAPEDCPVLSSGDCPEGKEYQECGTACPLNCTNKAEFLSCTKQCVQGCFCPEGTVELGDKCVAPEECLGECPAGKVFLDCGTACPTTCENKDDLLGCTEQCVQGCFCPEGTVELDDKCVAPVECPVVCPAGKVFLNCGTSCPTTCENKDNPQGCILRCVPDCFCAEGTVELGDKCVAPEDCPVLSSGDCPEGKEFRECGTACRGTCDNIDEPGPQPCPAVCVRDCFCLEGTVELGDKCVAPEDCPDKEPECPEGKEYQECGTACPLNCTNKDELVICTRQCVQGCFCPEGTVELDDKCVAPEECPVEEPECPEGKEYQECGTACPDTCDNKDEPGPRPCPAICLQGCFCVGGTVELGDGCVVPEECPA